MAATVDRSYYLLGVIAGILRSGINTEWAAASRATRTIEGCANVTLPSIIDPPTFALGMLNGVSNFFFAMSRHAQPALMYNRSGVAMCQHHQKLRPLHRAVLSVTMRVINPTGIRGHWQEGNLGGAGCFSASAWARPLLILKKRPTHHHCRWRLQRPWRVCGSARW